MCDPFKIGFVELHRETIGSWGLIILEGFNGINNFLYRDPGFEEESITIRDPFRVDGTTFVSNLFRGLIIFWGKESSIEHFKGLLDIIEIQEFLVVYSYSINFFPILFLLKEVKEDFGAFISELEPVVLGSNEGSLDFDLLVLSKNVSGFRDMLGQGGRGGVSLNILL